MSLDNWKKIIDSKTLEDDCRNWIIDQMSIGDAIYTPENFGKIIAKIINTSIELIQKKELFAEKEKTKALLEAVHDWMEATDNIHKSFEDHIKSLEDKLNKLILWKQTKDDSDVGFLNELNAIKSEIEEMQEKLSQLLQDRAYFDNASDTDGLGQSGR